MKRRAETRFSLRCIARALAICLAVSFGPVGLETSAQALTCQTSLGPVVANKEMAAAIFVGVVHNRQTPETAKRFEVVAEPAVGDPKCWSVY